MIDRAEDGEASSQAMSTRATDLERQIHENKQTAELLKTLPEKIRHQIMVPEGDAAFFQGQLVHTNECKVHLGKAFSFVLDSRSFAVTVCCQVLDHLLWESHTIYLYALQAVLQLVRFRFCCFDQCANLSAGTVQQAGG